MPTREFTIAELADYNIPPDDPTDLDCEEYVLADEQAAILKYTALRRCVFAADDGKTYAVEYEAPLDTGAFELGDRLPDGRGWHGGTVQATEVEQLQVVVSRWVPVF
ncbi:hypothetical protein ABZ650_20525 [Streptomyces griseoviridis]|uniref:hypothetical protein n=1 Tax=Streptomyces griseoviridis TaxID=45398 RepID=UPI003410757A